MSDFATASTQEQVSRLTGLARRALAAWSLEARSLKLIKYRENAVFAVGAPGETRFVLRVHRPGYRSSEQVRSEAAWMRALAEVEVQTPEMLPTRTGDLVAEAAGEGVPEPRLCDLFRWVEGEHLGSFEDGVSGGAEAVGDAYRTLGGLAATLHEHGVRWKRPEGFARPAWGIEELVGENPTMGRFWELPDLDPDTCRLMLRVRDRVREDLAAFGTAPDRWGLVHGDFLPENVLVGPDGCRLIDFDDCGESWYGFELATALFPHLVRGEAATPRRAYLEGYRARRPFPEAQLQALPALLMARALSYAGWPVGRPEMHEARQLAPLLIELTTGIAERYLAGDPLGLDG